MRLMLLLIACLLLPLPLAAQEEQAAPPASENVVTAGEEPVEELPQDAAPTSVVKPVPAPEPDKEKPKIYTSVQLKGLNKVTTRTSTLEAPFGRVIRFGNLEIIAHRCALRDMGGVKDNAALLEIWELKIGESPTRIFQGWMFSSNQAVSAIEHPVYDVWVEQCSEGKAEE